MKSKYFSDLLFGLSIGSLVLSGCSKTNSVSQTMPPPLTYNDTVQQFREPDSLTSSYDGYSLGSVCIDNNNIKWTTNSLGILKFDSLHWTLYRYSDMVLPFTEFTSDGNLVCDNNGVIYSFLSTKDFKNSFVIEYANNKWRSFTLPYYAEVYKLDKATGIFYFKFTIEGHDQIYQYDGTGSISDFSSYSLIDLGNDYGITNFEIVNKNLIILFTQNLNGNAGPRKTGVIIRTENGDVKVINNPDTVNLPVFNEVASRDGINMMMFGYEYYGTINQSLSDNLYILNDTTWKVLAIPVSYNYNSIPFPSKLKCGVDGTIRFVTFPKKMFKYSDQVFSSSDLNMPTLPFPIIVDYALDKFNVLWLSTNDGLVRFNVQ